MQQLSVLYHPDTGPCSSGIMSRENTREQFTQAMMITQACSLLGWGENPKEIVDKVNQLLRGLPKEDEFIAMSTWMGKCSLVHKLDQEQFPALSRDNYQVPDLFALYDSNGKHVPVLIEVKKTLDIRLKPFSNAYYSRLSNYARLMHLPLLIAWYIERLNMWCLFELERMTKKRSAFHIDFQTATNNSLLGILADDIILTVNKGVKLLFRIRKDPKTVIRDSNSGEVKKFTGIMEEIVWVNPKGQEIACSPNLRSFLELVFRMVDNDVTDSEDGTHVTITFYTTSEENLFAHQLLGVMAFGSPIAEGKRPTWLEVIRNNRFRMDYYSVREAASEGVKSGMIRWIIRQNPATLPEFLA